MERNLETFQLIQDGRNYIVTSSIVDDKLKFTCINVTDPNSPKYFSEFSFVDLRESNDLFKMTNCLEDAKLKLEKAIEDQKIGIDEEPNSVNLLFYTMIGNQENDIVFPLTQAEGQAQGLAFNSQPQINQEFDYYLNQGSQACNCTINPNVSKLENETNRLRQDHEILKSEVGELKRKTENLRSQNDTLENDNSNLRERNRLLENSNNADKQEILKLTREKEELLVEIKRITNMNIELEKELKNLRYQNMRNAQFVERNSLQKQNEGIIPTKVKASLESQRISVTRTPVNQIIKGEIIHSPEELSLISKNFNSEGNNVNLNLIYKASADSDKAQAFHLKCDSAKSTLVLVETTDGKRFGGYTSCNWAGNCIDKKDNNAFIFSLDKMKVYEVKRDEDAIGCYPDYGPIFLGCQIRIYDNAFTRGGTTFERDLNYNTLEDFELNGGIREFGVKDIEVYNVSFE